MCNVAIIVLTIKVSRKIKIIILLKKKSENLNILTHILTKDTIYFHRNLAAITISL